MQEKGAIILIYASGLKEKMKKHIIFMVFIFAMVIGSPAKADLNNALQAVSKNQWDTAYQQAAMIQSPLERDIFNWYAFKQGDSRASFNNILDFLNRRGDWPSQSKIQSLAEKKISSATPPAQIIALFKDNDPRTADGAHAYVRALLATGNTSKLKSFLNDWWPEASLSRDDQREIYNRYSGHFNRKAHVDRLNKLMLNNEYSNAQGIAGVLGGGYPTLVQTRMALRKGESSAGNLVGNVAQNLQNDEGLLLDRLTWERKRKNNNAAIQILNRSPSANYMTEPKLWWQERHIIIRRLIEQKRYSDAYSLAASHKQTEEFPRTQAEWVSGWLALRFINKPDVAFRHFETLYNVVETPISKSRGSYWAGLASQTMGRDDIANKWYQVASRYPQTYYGQMAARTIGQEPNIMSIDNASSVANADISNTDMAKAASAFRKAGLSSEVKSFLYQLYLERESASDLMGASKFASQMGYEEISIRAAQKLQNDHGINAIKYLYPIVPNSSQYIRGISPATAHAIIRQESRFDQNAVSHAGARGLMQLMPGTASDTARKLGIQHQQSWLTSRPTHNVQLGSTYLKQMLDRYNGNLVMAAAAYNAGPGRVDRWISEIGDPRTGQISMLDWAELIPIYETRNYAQRVIEADHVYSQLIR